MPKYQKAEYKEDTIKKIPLTEDDIAFLKILQKELCTQDDMGNADPRFWMIRQEQEYPAADGFDDETVLTYDWNSEIFHSLKEFADWLNEGHLDEIESAEILKKDDRGNDDVIAIHISEECNDYQEEPVVLIDFESIRDFFEDIGIEGFNVLGVCHKQELVQDTLFLTHKDCEDHLTAYGYNYHADAHAYCMTATRSPRFEKLIKLLQSVDWDSVRPKQR